MQRYTLDLSEFYSDHRQKVFVRRKPEWNKVYCLLDHVRGLLQLSEDIYLTNETAVLFPENEDLDIILENDQLRVHIPSNSSDNPNTEKTEISYKEHGKKQTTKLEQEIIPDDSDSDSCSDSSSIDVLPRIFNGLENGLKHDDEIDALPKPKRKRIRKRKSKKKVSEEPPAKVVVKTYGKSKVPPIVIGNGSTNHVRFTETEQEVSAHIKDEPYMNVNRNTVPRIVKAIHQPVNCWEGEMPSVPDFEDAHTLEFNELNKGSSRQRKPRNSLTIKKELIEVATATIVKDANRTSSPTWDTELDQAKETFVANYSGAEFLASLKDALANFPTITIPSVNDVIACTTITSEAWLCFVERVDDGADDNSPSLRLTLRRLDVTPTRTQTVTLDQLAAIKLVATYQP